MKPRPLYPFRALLAHSDPAVRSRIASAMVARGIEVIELLDGHHAQLYLQCVLYQKYRAAPIGVLVLGADLPGWVDAVRWLHQLCWPIPVAIVSSEAADTKATLGDVAGQVAMLNDPFGDEELDGLLQQLVRAPAAA